MVYAFPLDASFSPFQFTRNRLEHIIAAVDPSDYPNRQNLRYELTLNAPEYAGLQILEPFLTLPGREKPPIITSGESTFEGAKFSVQGELDGLLYREKPSFQQSQISVISSLTMPFSFTEVVKYEGTEIVSQAIPPQWAIKAGLAEIDHDAWGSSYWTHYHANRFLTWQPDNKIVGSGQEEYLYFLLNFSPAPSYIKLRVDVTYTDAATETFYPSLPIQDVPFGRILCVPVGPSIALKDAPGSVIKYEVYLVDQLENRLSEKRTYWPDRKARRQERFIMFSNSFHSYDTLRLVGDGSELHKVQRFYADRERPIGAGSDFSDLFMIDKVGESEITISTGYFEKDSAEMTRYLSEFLLAEEWYLISQNAHEPLELVTTSQVSSEDSPGLVSRSYTLRKIRDASNYSFLPPAPVFAGRATYWKGSKPQYMLDGLGKRTGYVRYGRIVKTYLDTDTSYIPLTIKANSPGDADYLPEYLNPDITPGSTPFPSGAISRAGTFNRTNCGAGFVGGPATIVIAAGKYGGENAGEANLLAEAEYTSLNTQATANTSGTCTVNTTPIHGAILHKLPMDGGFNVIGSGDSGPVVDLRIDGVFIVPNTVGASPPSISISGSTMTPGLHTITCNVSYHHAPLRPCKLRIASKNKEINVSDNGLYSFGEIMVYSSDEPLTVEVL
jgi:hypothetical protein